MSLPRAFDFTCSLSSVLALFLWKGLLDLPDMALRPPGPSREELCCGGKQGNGHQAVFQTNPKVAGTLSVLGTAGQTPAITTGAHGQLSIPCSDLGRLKETFELCEEMQSSPG